MADCNSQEVSSWYTNGEVGCADTGAIPATPELESLDMNYRLVKIKAVIHLLEKQVYLGKL